MKSTCFGKRAGSDKGFTLIELLVVVGIIGILAAIAIPGYVGMQNKSKKATMIRSCTSIMPELQSWLVAAHSDPARIDADTNFDGKVDALDDSNATLAIPGNVAKIYVTKRLAALNEKSAYTSVPLWINGIPGPGQIGITQNAGTITLAATDGGGNPIAECARIVTAD